MMKNKVFPMLFAFLLGILSVGAFAPFNAFFLVFIGFAGLLALLNQVVLCGASQPSAKARFWKSAALGLSFGLGFFLAGVSWVYISLATFGGMPAPLAALATLVFCMVIALYPALACGFFGLLAPASVGKSWQRGLLFAALWTIFEWLRGFVFTGFPWLSIGYSQAPISPLAGFAPVFGVFSLSFLSLLLAGWLYDATRAALKNRGTKKNAIKRPTGITRIVRVDPTLQVLFPLLMILVLLFLGLICQMISWVKPQGEPFSVSLVQGNIAQEMKWRPGMFDQTLRLYYQMALENPAQLTVFPEAAIPGFYEQIPPDYLAALQRLASRNRGDILVGVAVREEKQYFNAAVGVVGVVGKNKSADSNANNDTNDAANNNLNTGKVLRYQKSHLVPFGEFLPPGFAWFMAWLNIPMSGFSPGEENQPPLPFLGQKLAVNICYEDAFGEEIIRALPEATVLVNLSNIAWFGDSLAPAQHGQISSLRALETGRMMLRATNTGLTAIIGIDGKIVRALPPFTRGVLQGRIQGYQGMTPYVRWGNWPVIVISFIVLLFLGVRTFRTVAKAG